MIAETLEQQTNKNATEETPAATATQTPAAPTTSRRAEKGTPAPTSLSPELERSLVQVFKLLSDETRLRILLHLHKERELHVSALCERLQQSQPAVSHHLALLRVAGLIEARRDGKHNFYSVRTDHLEQVLASVFAQLSQPGDADLRLGSFLIQQSL